jgi:hypothetical protein
MHGNDTSNITTREAILRLLEIERVKIPEGLVYDSKVRVTSRQLIHINFVSEKLTKKLPNDDFTLINYPGVQGRKFIIQNRGPAVLRWSLNAKEGSTLAMNRLTQNEGDNDSWDGFPLYRSVNLIAEVGYCDVEFSIRI